MPHVELDYEPRPLQWALHAALDTNRFVVAVCHRRFGKTVCAVNQLIKGALTSKRPRPRYHYIAPTFRQGKAACWDYLKHFASAVPNWEKNESELRVDFPNGGQVQILGADNPDSMRGIYSDGAVFDEYGLQPPNVFTEVMRPALADRIGWAMFIGTPNGKNQFYDIVQQAKGTAAGWFFAEYRASDTGIVDPKELEAAQAVMTKDEYQQEFECSFEASVKGAIYADELQDARAANRITRVPWEPLLPVNTAWDLGVGDASAIWFSQSLSTGEVRLVDYYEATGEGLPHYAQMLKAKGYAYDRHIAPHDIRVREFSSGRSRMETAASLGIHFEIAPQMSVEEGIHAVRMLLPRCYFDAERCKAGLEALQHYRRDYNSRLNEFKPTAVHDWAEHGASAFRYLALTERAKVANRPKQPMAPKLRGETAWMG